MGIETISDAEQVQLNIRDILGVKKEVKKYQIEIRFLIQQLTENGLRHMIDAPFT